MLFFLFNSNYHCKDRSVNVKKSQKDKYDFNLKFLFGVFDFTYELQIKKILKEIFEKHKASQKPFSPKPFDLKLTPEHYESFKQRD